MHDCTITRRQLWLQAMQRLLALVLPLILLGLIGKLQSTQDKIFLVQLQATSATCTIIFFTTIPSAASTSITSKEPEQPAASDVKIVQCCQLQYSTSIPLKY